MSELEALNPEQVNQFREMGYLVVENRIPEKILRDIRAEIERFEVEACGMEASNDRLDLEDSHSPDDPRLRRIKLPHKICEPVGELLHSDHILAPVRDLIGPDLRLHTSKLNMKSAGFGAAVEWHQDFAFYPHTNDDVLADRRPDRRHGRIRERPTHGRSRGRIRGRSWTTMRKAYSSARWTLRRSWLRHGTTPRRIGGILPARSRSITAASLHGSALNTSDRRPAACSVFRDHGGGRVSRSWVP